MKGVLLAGGTGSRLGIVTKRLYNKHVALVYDKPMVLYPIQTMVDCGIEDLILVTGDKHAGDFVSLIGDGKEFGLKSIQYVFQYAPDGIAGALREAGKAMNGNPDDVLVILGDNYFDKSEEIRWGVDNFRGRSQTNQAMCFLKKVSDPCRFGVADISGGDIHSIEEKPKHPKSDQAIIGAYCFSEDVFERITDLQPSGRGEFEVTDLLKSYMQEKALGYAYCQEFWSDMGTPESLADVVKHIHEGRCHGRY